MRTEVKVGLISGLVVIVGGIIFFFQQSQQTGSNVANSLPMDAPAPQKETRAADNANKNNVATPSRRTPARGAELAADAKRKQQRPNRQPGARGAQANKPADSEQKRSATSDEIQARLRERLARQREEQKKHERTPAATPADSPKVEPRGTATKPPTPRPTAAKPAAGGQKSTAGPATARPQTPKPTEPDRKVADAQPRPGVTVPAPRGSQRPAPRTTPLPGKPLPAKVTRHTVEPGDSLWSIAEQYYDDGLLWKKLAEANPDTADTPLKIGQIIVVPPKEQVTAAPAKRPTERDGQRDSRQPTGRSHTYVVEHGDSLILIARNILGDDDRWREIYELNRDKISDPDVLKVGTELKLPPKEKK